MLLAIRLSLPDRPGMLGSVATALSHAGADIVHLTVVDREGGYAVDEICVETVGGATRAAGLRRAAEAIPGVVVEAVRLVDRPPDPLAPLVLADRLARGEAEPFSALVRGLPGALPCAWAMAVEASERVRVLHATPGAPPPGVMETPWLPLHGARRLTTAEWMPPRWRMSRFELAAAPLGGPATCVIAGRWSGMRFRQTELRQLELLCGMAVRAPRLEPA